MSKYLLLRSNKQTGPYSLEEMKGMGLKAYDLVWVEGKSAAWRYPGEVEELKPFSPPVEEQPFDRFFKRPTQINQPLFQTSPSEMATRVEKPAEMPKQKPEFAQVESKSIFSSLPTEKPLMAESMTEVRPVLQRQPDQEKKAAIPVREQKEYMPRPSNSENLGPKREILWEEESFRVSNKSTKSRAQQRPTIKEAAMLQGGFLKPFAIGFGLAAFLGIGIFIGLNINNRGTNTPKDLAVKEDLTTSGQQAFYRAKNQSRQEPDNQNADKKLSNNSSPNGEVKDAASAEALAITRKKARAKQKVLDSLKLVSLAPVVDSNAMVAATQIAHTTESANLKKDLVKNNISDYVTLSGNKFNVGTFGGISQLQLTVSNRSGYPLDLVVVEIQYIQSNKKIYKTETLYFRNIGAGSALMEEAPKSSRGVNVQYKITLINSKELGLAFTSM